MKWWVSATVTLAVFAGIRPAVAEAQSGAAAKEGRGSDAMVEMPVAPAGRGFMGQFLSIAK